MSSTFLVQILNRHKLKQLQCSAIYRVRLKKMTQHQKCDYSVTHDNFCAKFCKLVGQGPAH